MSSASPPLDWFVLGMSLFGGLALFLAGLELLSEGLKKAAGQALRRALERLTTNRFLGALTGAFVTGVLNSSSVTTVLVVGFVTAGVMTLAQSVGVIMGANIGSTVTAQILAFNLSAYALLPVAVGFFMMFAGRSERMRHSGMMVMGLGLVFYGMGVMSDGMKPLRAYEPFLTLLRNIERPGLGVLVGALFTALVQSSAATVGIAIALAGEGLLSLPGGITLALGANIGTCVTALLAALGKPTEAVRAAVVHLSFNVLGVVLWLPLIPALSDLAVWASPSSPGLQGTVRLAAEVPRQIANANTLFNVLNTFIFLGFTGAFARLAVWVVPDRGAPPGVIVAPEFLDEAALKAPALALQRVRLELGRAGAIALDMLEEVGPALWERDLARLEMIVRRDDEVDVLQAEILGYLGRIRQSLLTERESLEHQQLMAATVTLEGLADVVETDLVRLIEKVGDSGIAPDEISPIVEGIYRSVCRAVGLAVQAIRDDDQRAAAEVIAMKSAIREQAQLLVEAHAARLAAPNEDFILAMRVRMEAADQLQRVYDLARRIARGVLPSVLSQAA